MYESSFGTAFGKLILRLTVGGLMLFHGIHKVLHPESLNFISSNLETAGLPGMLAYGVYVGEIVAPLMIISPFMPGAPRFGMMPKMEFELYRIASISIALLP